MDKNFRKKQNRFEMKKYREEQKQKAIQRELKEKYGNFDEHVDTYEFVRFCKPPIFEIPIFDFNDFMNPFYLTIYFEEEDPEEVKKRIMDRNETIKRELLNKVKTIY